MSNISQINIKYLKYKLEQEQKKKFKIKAELVKNCLIFATIVISPVIIFINI